MINHFRLKLVISLSALLVSLPVLASIGIRISSDRNKYIQYEPIEITLTLRNNTGNRLNFGESGAEGQQRGSLLLHVTDGRGNEVRQINSPEKIISNLELAAGESKQFTFPLNNFYHLSRDTTYTIYAQAGHDRLSHDYRSDSLRFEVLKAHPIWQQDFGIPAEDDDEKITTRTASIRRLSHGKDQVYCFQIEDDKYVYTVRRIADHIHGADPRGLIDGQGKVHIFLRIQSRIFLYQVYDHTGRRIQEAFYTFENQSRPRMTRDSRTGNVHVLGGRRAQRNEDYILPEDMASGERPVDVPVVEIP